MTGDSTADLSRELAKMPVVWTALLTEHTVDPNGRRRGCRSPVGPGQRWPCTLYRVAARARCIATTPVVGP